MALPSPAPTASESMTDSAPTEANILALEQAAAQAKKLADDARRGRLWERDWKKGLGQIRQALNDACRRP